MLGSLNELSFYLPGGAPVPKHFHITEAGLMRKDFLDCGGTRRSEAYVSFQIWVADDIEHRLSPEKLLQIISKSSPLWEGLNPEIRVEYQENSVGVFGLAPKDDGFVLVPTQTDCLAREACGTPLEKKKISLSELGKVKCC